MMRTSLGPCALRSIAPGQHIPILLYSRPAFRHERYRAPLVRVFASTPFHRKEPTRIHNPPAHEAQKAIQQQEGGLHKQEEADSVRPETIQKQKAPNPDPDPDVLLSEPTLSSKEQRKADWGIIKEMSKYLWPKDNLWTRLRVGASVGLLIGAKVSSSGGRRCWSGTGLTCLTGAQCAGPILLQEHCRLYEH